MGIKKNLYCFIGNPSQLIIYGVSPPNAYIISKPYCKRTGIRSRYYITSIPSIPPLPAGAGGRSLPDRGHKITDPIKSVYCFFSKKSQSHRPASDAHQGTIARSCYPSTTISSSCLGEALRWLAGHPSITYQQSTTSTSSPPPVCRPLTMLYNTATGRDCTEGIRVMPILVK